MFGFVNRLSPTFASTSSADSALCQVPPHSHRCLVPTCTRSNALARRCCSNHSPRDSCTRLRPLRTHRLVPTWYPIERARPSPMARTTLPEILACSSGLRAPTDFRFRLGLCPASFSAQVWQRSMGRLDLRHRDGLSPTHCPTPARQRKPVTVRSVRPPFRVCIERILPGRAIM